MAEKTNVPEIRFAGFTDPWEQRKLGDELKRIQERNREGLGDDRWISVSRMYFQNPDKVQSNNLDTRTYVMRHGDMAFEGHKNSEHEYGRLVVNDIGDGIISELFPIYRHKWDFDNQFWKYAAMLETIWRPIFARSIAASGNSSNKLIDDHMFSESVFVPCVEEQRAIGTLLHQIDRTITLHQRKYDKLAQLKKSMLDKIFPKPGERFPEIRFAGFTDPWEQRKLGELGSVAMCKRIFKEQTTEQGDVPFYKIGTFGGTPDAFISRELFDEYQRLYQFPKVGDILISAAGTIGRTIVYQGDPAYYQDSNIVWLQHDERLDNGFLLQFLNGKSWSSLEGSTLKRLYNKDLLNAEIATPSPNEQHQIGSTFAKLDDIITLHQRKLELLRNTKKSLLDRMFV